MSIRLVQFHSIKIYDSGAQEFLGGRVSVFITKWQKITSDNKFLQITQCCEIEFDEKLILLKMPYQQKFERTQEVYIIEEVENLLLMNVREVQHIRGVFILTIFTLLMMDGEQLRKMLILVVDGNIMKRYIISTICI